MRKRIKRADITRIALVKYPANGLSTVIKSDGAFEIQTLVSKSALSEGLLTAVVYAPDMEDTDGWFAKSAEVKDFAHRFMRDGKLELDLEHDGHVLSRDEAYIAESFLLSGTEPFLKSIKHNGESVDPAALDGAWAMRIKLESEELKEAARNGDFDGVSMFGTAKLERVEKSAAERVIDRLSNRTAKETKMDEKQMEALLKSAFKGMADELKTVLEPVIKAVKPEAPKADTPAAEEQPPVFEGDPDDIKALEKFQKSVRAYELRKQSKAGKLSSADVEALIKAKKDAQASPSDEDMGIEAEDTPAVKALKRENFELRKGSNQPVTKSAPKKDGDEAVAFGKSIGTHFNERAGSTFAVVKK